MNLTKLDFQYLLSTLIFLLVISCENSAGKIQNIKEDKVIYIPSDANFNSVLDSLKPVLNDSFSFVEFSKYKGYTKLVKAGKYKLKKGETNKVIVTRLLTGEQSQQKLTIKNHPTLFHLAGHVSKQIEEDSTSLINEILNSDFAKKNELNEETLKPYFLPNTYFVWWNTTPKIFVARMQKEYDKFWNEKRQSSATKLGLSILEVLTLASIVQLESSSNKTEQSKVARAYLNRLKKDMKLQADPTSVYGYKKANGFKDPVFRVYHKHILFKSPYNTYLNTGLPPSPICLPNTTTIDAVLEPAIHDYIYFCAKPDNSGTHNFTSNFSQHQKNAIAYRVWLNTQGIR